MHIEDGGSELSAQHRLYDRLASERRKARRNIGPRRGAYDVASGLLKLFRQNPEYLEEIRNILFRPQKKQ